MISASHLKLHSITTKEYMQRFPGARLRVQTPESRARMAAAKVGTTPWNKGIKTGPNPRLSAAKKGKPNLKLRGSRRTPEQRRNISEKTKLAMRTAMTDAVRQKIAAAIARSKALGTYAPSMLGKSLSAETREKISQANRKAFEVKRRQLLEKFTEVANARGITVEAIEDNYWFKLRCQRCGARFTTSRQAFQPSTRNGLELCPTCHPRGGGQSRAERELYDLIKTLDPTAVANDRVVLGGKELDIYLPDKKVAFELTGLYWHAEGQNPEPKHLLWKTQYAYNKGVTLYTIFEDEWTLKREIVESRIRGILGLHDRVVPARRCQVAVVDARTKNEFLLANHLQGKDACAVALGLLYKGELVAVATFKRTNMVKGGDGSRWELSRFCSKLNTRVPGGASRLISHFMRNFNEAHLPLISYADRRWSTGKLYKAIGFRFAGTTPPSYWYTLDYKTRLHRAALMKHRLVRTEEDAQLTEWQLAQRRGYDRIWDCGTTKWVLDWESWKTSTLTHWAKMT